MDAATRPRRAERKFGHYLVSAVRRDTFAGRVLDETPKFVREKLRRAEESAKANAVGTSDERLR